MTHTLTEDHVIVRKNSKAVVKKGSKVTLLTIHDNIAIVEADSGERFSCQLKIIDKIKLP